MKYLRGILLPALLALAPLATAKNDPIVVETVFDGEPVNLFYFDDSDVAVLAELETSKVFRSADAGKTWEEQKGLRTVGVIKNPFDNKVAVALGGEQKHWITYDQGENWNEFKTKYPPSMKGPPLSFHAKDNKKILYHTFEDCHTTPCLGETYLTEDGFKSDPKLVVSDRKMCQWAKSTDRFLMDEDKHDNRILCITRGKYSLRSKDNRLLISDDYFETAHEPVMSSGRTVQGMSHMAAVKGYLVAAAKSDKSNELSLYVTDDTETWHHAEFGDGKIEEDAYTVLESTNYSIQVDVVTHKFAYVGSLYTSNSNGTYFTKNIENTNRDEMGYVDFEKISNIQGIVIVNVVENPGEAEGPFAKKKLKTQISFDDGRTFESLKVKDTNDDLHLHSVTNLHNSGRVFSSPAPGLVMGVGNTGKLLGKYTDGDLWVSDDAGLTWEMALQEAHKYEFGDQGSVLVAVFDEGDTDKIMYSLKHGRKGTWKEIELGFKIRARELTTVPDSTTLKFILYGSKIDESSSKRKHAVLHLDFNGLHEGKCSDSDFEDWSARKDEKGDPMCVMGHKQTFRRRKWDAECFVQEKFKDPVPTFEACACDEVRDYECDYNFTPTGQGRDKKCEPSRSFKLPDGVCKSGEKTYKGSSGWRKIPGNECNTKTAKDEEVERKCDESAPPSDEKPKDKPMTSKSKFKGSHFREYYYLERSTQSDDDKKEDKDETVVMLTDEKEAWISHDHGKKWKKVVDDAIVAIYPHQYNNDYVYFLTATKKVYYSVHRGLKEIHSFDAPQMPNTHQLQILQFHPAESDWLIWVGGEHCERSNDRECHTEASVSQKNGKSWEPLLTYVKKCAFIWREAGRHVDKNEVFCEWYTNEEMGAPVELLSSKDWFKTKDVKFKSVVEFATMSEFIIVATKGDDGNSLNLHASLDAKIFAEAKFPPKFDVSHQTAYTVLDSSTHSVFLHVTVNGRMDQEYGSIIKSNSNGTSYVLSLNNVNRNTAGYVDFEKMQGIEGVALANIVENVKDVDQSGAKKRKQTRITHNDGADWEPLTAPALDGDDQPYKCDGCHLHLHGYTERRDPRETFSSPTAVGIAMGIGNVGKELTTIGEANTYLTTDAGITWKEAKKGNYAWEFGDQGSVIVLVRRGEDIRHLYYTLNLGENWDSLEFSEHAVRIDAITTVPSDTSLNFLLWGKDGRELVTFNIDFSVLPAFQQKCELDKEHPEDGDFYLWKPQRPMQDDKECLFGHVASYHRKRSDRECYAGQRIDNMYTIEKNCTCTRRDFECDYNFEKEPGGECKPIQGLDLPDPKAVCEQGATEYWDITGYRKIPISTCSGGKEMSHTSSVHPCPGHEEEFERKHGISGFGIFMAVVIPFMAAGGIGYYVWRNWDGKFGRIRLGDGSGGFDSESPWISWPVAAISGLVAVVAAVPLVLGSLWRMVSSQFGGYGGRTYTSRSSFARGRGDYAVVDPDEGELLGEDSDEDV